MFVSPKLLLLPPPKKIASKKHLPFLLPMILGFLIILTAWQKNGFFFSEKAQFKTKLWPQLPTTHFSFARDLLNKGQKGLAQKEFDIAKNQVEDLNKIYLGFLFKKNLKRTEELIYKEEKIEEELEELEEQLEKTPYSWQLLLKKAVLAYQIYQNEKAQEAWQTAYWLDPNNEEVLGLKEKLEIK